MLVYFFESRIVEYFYVPLESCHSHFSRAAFIILISSTCQKIIPTKNTNIAASFQYHSSHTTPNMGLKQVHYCYHFLRHQDFSPVDALGSCSPLELYESRYYHQIENEMAHQLQYISISSFRQQLVQVHLIYIRYLLAVLPIVDQDQVILVCRLHPPVI